jgi:anthranilate/para-aminobenzoate synthase component II
MSQKTTKIQASTGMLSKMNSDPIKFHSLFEHEGADQGMADLFTKQGWQDVHVDLADIIVFNGGADIGTSLYGEKPIGRGIPELPSKRDCLERDLYMKYKGGPKLLLGICRGAQFLNVMNGGTLWQDVNNHGSTHDILILATGQKYRSTSTHHQMMRPHSTGRVLAVADEATRKYSDLDTWTSTGGVHFQDDHKDTEIVWYPSTGSLCIQGHPEYVPTSEFATFCIDMITHFLEEVRVEA